VVKECIDAGIKDIVLVTHASKNSIENHFDTSFELEATLEKRVKRQLLDEVKAICPKDVTIMHVRQGVAKGLGHAILCAKPLIGDESFTVVLPDVLIDDALANPKRDNLAEMISTFNSTGASQIMVEKVPQADVCKFGIVDIAGAELAAGESAKLSRVVEKPALEDAPSDLAVVGRYVLDSDIWALLAKTPPGAGDEIQLTDAIDELLMKKSVEAYYMKGKSHDCGSKLGYLKANVEYGLRHPEVASEFAAFLQQITS
jgi:UTP--glucose-1-phosphate uridylyltransferase